LSVDRLIVTACLWNWCKFYLLSVLEIYRVYAIKNDIFLSTISRCDHYGFV